MIALIVLLVAVVLVAIALAEAVVAGTVPVAERGCHQAAGVARRPVAVQS